MNYGYNHMKDDSFLFCFADVALINSRLSPQTWLFAAETDI